MVYGYAKILDKAEEDVKIVVPENFSPKDFFVTKDGLFIYSDFNERILDKATEVSAGTEYSLTSGTLLTSANDAMIESALLEDHDFSESDVCAIVSELIKKQPAGEEGALKTDGSWNIFYTPAFVVVVYWYARGRFWRVFAWLRSGGGWLGGGRVFSPAVS